MRIYMNLTKKEVRRICLTNSFWDFRKKGILLIVVLILSILTSLSVVIMNPEDIMFALAIVVLVVVTVARFAGSRILKSVKAVFCYWRKKNNNVPDYVETDDDGISCFSNNFLSFYAWSTGLEVHETKKFYFIVTSIESRLAVPRRCFTDQKQLDEFVTLLETKITPKRLHLKNYPIGIPAPDLMEQIIPTLPLEIKEEILEKPAAGEELFSLRFTPHEKDFCSANLWIYFTSWACILVTLLVLLFAAPFVGIVINGSIWQGELATTILFFIMLIIGLLFWIMMPVQIVSITKKVFDKSETLSNAILYQFYKDSFLVESSTDNKRLRFFWKDLIKITEFPRAYCFFVTKQVVYIIPKSVFADDIDKKEMMKTLLDVARKQMKKG